MQYSEFQNLKLSRLGFGMMRLPLHQDGPDKGSINESLVDQMIACAIRNGVNYFDTAYPYHGGMSEIVTGRILKNYPRNSFCLASKYPGHQYADSYDPASIFEEQLKKCQVDYFDFYLLHNVCESCIQVYEDPKWRIIDYFVEQKKLGRIRHLGFSSHAELNTLRHFVEAHRNEMEFCQIQLNYLDWNLQHAKEKYEYLTAQNIPVWVMEPVRGGRLANLSEEAQNALHAINPDASCASWAFRWICQLPNVKVILSGMSDLSQVQDNIQTFSHSIPLNENETHLLNQIAAQMHQIIPCTSCRYCCSECPQGLDIPMLLNSLNDARFAPNFTVGMRMESLPSDKLPSACIACGSCAQICPQHIDIPSLMAEYAGMLNKLPSWKAICEERARAARALKNQ
ncbi:MAG: aldo/keto reductase [Proteobacteria bacterium]|nr:aldo/keto reductase [Pseudomonadota bacterium]